MKELILKAIVLIIGIVIGVQLEGHLYFAWFVMQQINAWYFGRDLALYEAGKYHAT